MNTLANRAATNTLMATMLYVATLQDALQAQLAAEMSSGMIMGVVAHEATCPCRRLK